MFKIKWRPKAERDLSEIWHFIARDDERAADRYVRDLVDAANSLADMPHRAVRRPDIHADAHALIARRHLLLFAVQD